MSVVQTVNYQLNKYPWIKKKVKRIYQKVNYIVSKKTVSEGDIIRLSPDDNAEYFFGYYDKSPWDATGRYVICLRAKDTWSSVAPKEEADILLIDTRNGNAAKKIASANAWNVQQGCMAQWLGPDFDRQIIYNDFRDGKYCSVILDVFSGEERQLSMPVYSVSTDGKTALTLDFARLHRLRPGYGYSNLPDMTEGQPVPDGPCIWRIDIERDEITELLRYRDFVSFEPRSEMQGAEHKVNHIMLSPNGQRFMVLHRWFRGQRKYTRLVTCDIDGKNMFNLSDEDMVSHCCWKNDREILAYEKKHAGGLGYYLMRDKTKEYSHLWPELTMDGHPSYSPDGKYVLTDNYPDKTRMASIRVMDGDNIQVIARVFAPFKYDNDTRCDLHPRWSRDGKSVCFDSVFEGHRGLYMCKYR